jgi:hypothetical protein
LFFIYNDNYPVDLHLDGSGAFGKYVVYVLR